MSLLNICIEVRKELCCANVFLQFDDSLSDNEFLKINVDAAGISLRELSSETRAELANYFHIETHTMCNLIVAERNASFRLCIKNINEQAFINGSNASDGRGNANSGTTIKYKPLPVPAAFDKNMGIGIYCSNCGCQLTAEATYKRIMEFPDGDIDTCKFFCHQDSNFAKKLVPDALDIFYGFYYIVLNANALRETTKTRERHIYCQRCLQLLGETLLAGHAIKIWTDSVRVGIVGVNKLRELYENSNNNIIAQLMQYLLHQATLSHDNATPLLFIKVLLECSLPNRQRRYLLLHILELQLQVLRNRQKLVHGSNVYSNSDNNNNVLQIHLDAQKCYKLMFLLFEQEQAEQLDVTKSLLNAWQTDVSIYTQRISPYMFGELLMQLEQNAQLLPDIYRRPHKYGFQFSYIFCEND